LHFTQLVEGYLNSCAVKSCDGRHSALTDSNWAGPEPQLMTKANRDRDSILIPGCRTGSSQVDSSNHLKCSHNTIIFIGQHPGQASVPSPLQKLKQQHYKTQWQCDTTQIQHKNIRRRYMNSINVHPKIHAKEAYRLLMSGNSFRRH
jgi:hypothetical protein